MRPQLLVPIAERLAHHTPGLLELLRRRFGLPVYRPIALPDTFEIDWDRLMRETPWAGRADDAAEARS